MSVWSDLVGEVRLRKGSHFSIKKSIYDFFDEVSVSKLEQEHLGEVILVNLDIHFSYDGMDAVHMVEKFIKAIKEADKAAYVDLTASIRFVA